MEELSNTERLIVSYIKSHPPEDCMLDKITRGTGRSRATVLKYLEILHAKGILDYKFVGRSKLWLLKELPAEKTVIMQEFTDLQDMGELASIASRLHSLISKELKLKRSMDSPDTLVFTINTYMDIVATNDTFDTFFPKKALHDIINDKQITAFENAVYSLDLTSKATMEIDLMEKSGIYRPYKILLQPIVENKDITGTIIIGEELSRSKRTKRELETLLSIAQAASSASNEEQLMKEATQSINDMIPYKYCIIFLRDNEKLRIVYKTQNMEINDDLLLYIKGFIEKSMSMPETMSAGEGDYYLETVKSKMEDISLSLMLSIPIIDEDAAVGSILLLTTLTSVSSINIENVEMAADELSGYLKMQRLSAEKEEFTNTLLAMNRISNVLNSTSNEDKMLEKAVKSTIDSLGFEMGCIYLKDDKDELTLRVHKNLPEGLKNMCMADMFKDLFSKTLEKQNIVYITSESDEYSSLEPAIRANDIKTLIILPIKSGNEIIGLLNMGSRQIKPYNNVSIENLSSIGLQLGLALERSKLAIKLKD